ncbi:MAG: 2-dehydropantoate 2-reductase [Pseudomonadota bacterium]
MKLDIKNISIAILGTGAVGSYVGACLQQSGCDIHFLARSTYKAIKSDGITVHEADGKIFNIKTVKVYNNTDTLPKADVVILTTRTAQNKSLFASLVINNLLKTNGIVISLQNGIDFERAIIAAISPHELLSGTSWIKVTQLTPSVVRHDFGNRILLGTYHNERLNVPVSQSGKKVKALLEHAGFAVELIENIQAVQWTKLALNLPLFAFMALYKKSASELLNNETWNQQITTFRQELINTAQACSCPVDHIFIDKTLADLKKMSIPSQKIIDAAANRVRVEIEANFGNLLRLLEKKKITALLLRNYYEKLSNFS